MVKTEQLVGGVVLRQLHIFLQNKNEFQWIQWTTLNGYPAILNIIIQRYHVTLASWRLRKNIIYPNLAPHLQIHNWAMEQILFHSMKQQNK